MSDVQYMPEVLKGTDIIESVMVHYNDKNQYMNDAINEAVEYLAKKVYSYGKQGTIDFQIKFTPKSRGDLRISATIKVKEPTGEADPMSAALDNRGRLYGEDPAQQKFIPTEIKGRSQV